MLPLMLSLAAFNAEHASLVAHVVPLPAPDMPAFKENLLPKDGSEYILPDLLFHQAESTPAVIMAISSDQFYFNPKG